MAFKVNDKVFAKVKGHPFWPARINTLPPEVKIPKGKFPIFFYGTHEVYNVIPKDIKLYEPHKEKLGKPQKKWGFNEGLVEIEQNPDILLYDRDAEAENFLSNYYIFMRSDGISSVEYRKRIVPDMIHSLPEVTQTNNRTIKPKTSQIEPTSSCATSISTVGEEFKEGTNDLNCNDLSNSEDDYPLIALKDSVDRPPLRKSAQKFLKEHKRKTSHNKPHHVNKEIEQPKSKNVFKSKQSVVRKKESVVIEKDLSSLGSISDDSNSNEKNTMSISDIAKKVPENSALSVFLNIKKSKVTQPLPDTKVKKRPPSSIKTNCNASKKSKFSVTSTAFGDNHCSENLTSQLLLPNISIRRSPPSDDSNNVHLVSSSSDVFVNHQKVPPSSFNSASLFPPMHLPSDTSKIQNSEDMPNQTEKDSDKTFSLSSDGVGGIGQTSHDNDNTIHRKNTLTINRTKKKDSQVKKKIKLGKKNKYDKQEGSISSGNTTITTMTLQSNWNPAFSYFKIRKNFEKGFGCDFTDDEMNLEAQLIMANRDIRNSLVRGQEDYYKCIGILREIQQLPFRVAVLARVKDLLDTLKKLRRYSLHKEVQFRAQELVNTFMEVFGKADSEDLRSAEIEIIKKRQLDQRSKTEIQPAESTISPKTEEGPPGVISLFEEPTTPPMSEVPEEEVVFEKQEGIEEDENPKIELVSSKESEAVVGVVEEADFKSAGNLDYLNPDIVSMVTGSPPVSPAFVIKTTCLTKGICDMLAEPGLLMQHQQTFEIVDAFDGTFVADDDIKAVSETCLGSDKKVTLEESRKPQSYASLDKRLAQLLGGKH